MASKEDKAAKGDTSPEKQQLEDLYKLMQTEGLDSLELKDGETSIRLVRRHSTTAHASVYSVPLPAYSSAAPVASTPPPVSPVEAAAGNTINTPLSGVFYRALSPTSAPFAKEGDVVESGQTLCIVEAMKVMNEIKAETRCKITKILAENSRPVTANQPLFQVESA